MKIYTIGHGNDPESFGRLLRKASVNWVIDVRSLPQSRFNACFGREQMPEWLAEYEASYLYMGTALGGRPRGEVFYLRGKINYNRRALAKAFREGIAKLIDLAGRVEGRCAVMCAEANPFVCHRHLLIEPALRAKGVEVVHLGVEGRQVELFQKRAANS